MILSENLSQFKNLIHGFTTKDLGDDYQRIAETLNLQADQIITLKQIHSDQVYVIDQNYLGDSPKRNAYEGDALVSDQSGIVVAVRTADCVPLLFYDPSQNKVAAVHAGWKGLIKGVIEATVDVMKINPQNLFVAIGPAICGDCFEVGPEVVGAFRKKFGDDLVITSGEQDRSYLDLRTACVLLLKQLGVNGPHIETLAQCTRHHNEILYSYRGGDTTGRQLSFIGLKARHPGLDPGSREPS